MLEQSLRQSLLLLIARPIAAYCLRHSHSLQDILGALKVAFVQIAAKDIASAGGRSNISRISVLTGVHRADVTKILKQRETPGIDRSSIIQRVIGQWRHDAKFSSGSNKPRTLSFDNPDSEFHKLVLEVTSTVHPAAVLRELERLGFVDRTSKGIRLKLQFESLSGDPEEGFRLLARDVDTLIRAVEENVINQPKSSNLHVRTEYDNIVMKELPSIRAWIREEGKAFHKRVREYLSSFDKDISAGLENEVGGGYVAVGAFAITEESSPEATSDENSSEVA